MRSMTVLAVGLLVVAVGGCSVMDRATARRSAADARRQRLEDQAAARLQSGDLDGAMAILERLKEDDATAARDRDRSSTARQRQEILSQTAPAEPQSPVLSRAERDQIIEQLLAMEPEAQREQKRILYQQMPAARLRQLLQSYRSTQLIGQNQLNRMQLNDAAAQLQVAQQNWGNGQSHGRFPDPPPRNPAEAPMGIGFPDASGTLPVSGTSNPMSPGVTAPEAASGVQRTSGTAAPRLPDNPARPAASISAPGLPLIQPGNSAPGPLPQIHPAGSAPLAPTGALTTQGPAGSGSTLTQVSGQAPVNPLVTTPSVVTGDNGSGIALMPPQPVVNPEALQSPGIGPVTPGNQLPTGVQSPIGTTPVLPDSRATSPTNNPQSVQNPPRPGIPGMLSSGVQSIQQSIRNVGERTGLNSLRPFGNQPVQPASATQNAQRPLSVGSLIQLYEGQLARMAPGRTEAERLKYVREHVNLRMLHLIAGQNDQAIEPIQGIEPTDQEFWQQMMWSMAGYFDVQGVPNSQERATQTIDQLRAAITRLKTKASLKLRNVTFCHRIVSFGDYERFSRDQFTPDQPVLLYAEVENFRSVLTDGDQFRTALKSTIEIYRAGAQVQPVATIPFNVTEDLCRNYRRDYFHSYEFAIPQNIEPGLYTLVLRVEDQLGGKTAAARVNFEVE